MVFIYLNYFISLNSFYLNYFLNELSSVAQLCLTLCNY